MTSDINQLSLSNIKELLQRETDFAQQMTSSDPPSGMIEAAVLLLLVEFDNRWQLVLTRRTNSVRDHKGQVSYPGGAREIEDTSLDQTALRETQEEIGILPSQIQILSSFPAMDTISNYWITPFIGTTSWPQPLNLAEGEVERVFLVPLDWLSNSSNWHYREFQIPGTQRVRKTVEYLPYQGEILWGISATLTHQLLDRLTKIPRN